MKHIIFIPKWRPASLNQLMNTHYMQGHKLKKLDKQMVAAYFRQVPKAEVKRRVGLHIVLGKSQNRADPDAYHKSLNDALVACGQLKDDSVKWCAIENPTYGRDWDNWGTEITLEDVE